MKKLLALLLTGCLLVALLSGCAGGKDAPSSDSSDTEQTTEVPTESSKDTETTTESTEETKLWKVAMITDYGDITDESFNQTTYEAGKAWCEAQGIDFKYYKPVADSTADRIAQIDAAVADGYNVLLLPGFAFAGAIVESQDVYTDVYFIALDVSEWDLEDSFYSHDTDGNRLELIDPNNEPHVSDNVYCAVYQEELAGYMAGYAAVKLGYKHLGFLGGMAVPAVIRYGYGFVQGCNSAAVELGIEKDVTVEYVYGNQFYGDADITAYMDTWYQAKGVEIVFVAGGSIHISACEAAAKTNGKIIGVDVDQAASIDSAYGEGMTVSSAMKGLAATVYSALDDLILNDNWAAYGGKVATLGLVSEDPEQNYVQIAPSTQFEEGKFTEDDYLALVAKLYKGEIIVSNDTGNAPEVEISVNYAGNIK